MFQYGYGPLIEAVAQLGQFSGYLDQEDAKAEAVLRAAYNRERNKLAYDIVRDMDGADAAISRVRGDLDSLASAQPDWAVTIAYLRDDLIERIEKDRSRNPLVKKLIRYISSIGLGLAATTYIGTWLYYDLTIDQPLESKAGLIQRAEAFDKVINYDEVMGGRGGLVRSFLTAPIEPDEEELVAAREFIEVAVGGYQELEAIGQACGIQAGEGLEAKKALLALTGKVSSHLRKETTVWKDPLFKTVLDPIKQSYPCP